MIRLKVYVQRPCWLFTVAFASACTKTPALRLPSYDDIQAACGFEEGIPVTDEYAGAIPISEDCSSALGDALGLDWDSFNAEPHAFSATNTSVEVVLSAALIALAPERLSVGEVLGDDPPEAFGSELESLSTKNGLDDTDSAGRVWLALVEGWIVGVEYNSSIESTMLYHEGVVSVSDLRDVAHQNGVLLTPVEVAGIITHEASHGFLHGHVACYVNNKPYCDDDLNGALGAEAWWDYQWLLRHHWTLKKPVCEAMVAYQDSTCVQIYIDHDTLVAFKPCGDASLLCSSPKRQEEIQYPEDVFSSVDGARSDTQGEE